MVTSRVSLIAAVIGACGPARQATSPAAAPTPASAPATPAAAPFVLVSDSTTAPDDPAAVWLVPAVAQRPRMLRPVTLVYPDSLRRRGVGGDVVVEFIVDTLGRVEREVRVIEAAHPGLREPARQTMRRAQFRPGTARGRKVRVLMTLRLRYVPRAT
jgi:protein TonB